VKLSPCSQDQPAGPDDYLDEEMRSVLSSVDLSDGDSWGLVVLIRALLRLRRIVWRATAVITSRPMRGLAGIYLCESNAWLIQRRLQILLQKISSLLQRITTSFDSQNLEAAKEHDRLGIIWSAASGELNEGEEEALFLAVDVDDLFARLAEFYYRDRPQTPAAKTIGKMMERRYGETLELGSDVMAPEAGKMERPLSDTIHDLLSFLRVHQKNRKTVLDYGAGLGRTRHFLYILAGGSSAAGDTKAQENIDYLSLEIQNTVQLLQSNQLYPNGPHLIDGKHGACLCRDNSSGDRLIIVDASSEQSIIGAFSFQDSDNLSLWQSQVCMEWPTKAADVALLVNVLHEVPFRGLGVLLGNLQTAVRPGGLVLVYEMLGLKSVEESYVVWQPGDVCRAFSHFGFHVLAFPGRTRDPRKGTWGHPYLLGCMVRHAGAGTPATKTESFLKAFWEDRVDRLAQRIEKLSQRFNNSIRTDSDQFEHFHAMHSLANAILQSQPRNK